MEKNTEATFVFGGVGFRVQELVQNLLASHGESPRLGKA